MFDSGCLKFARGQRNLWLFDSGCLTSATARNLWAFDSGCEMKAAVQRICRDLFVAWVGEGLKGEV